MDSLLRVFCTSCVLLLASGCGSDALQEDVIVSAQQAFDSGVAAEEAGDFAKASDDFKAALDGGGGLPPDLIVEAGFRRAKCLCETGKFEEALAAIDSVAEGAEGVDQVHEARAKVFLKQGDKTKAKEEYKLAKSANPAIKIPKGL